MLLNYYLASKKKELLDFIISIADADQELAPQEDAIIAKFREALALGWSSKIPFESLFGPLPGTFIP